MHAVLIAVLATVTGWFAHNIMHRWQTFRDLRLIIRCSSMAELIPNELRHEASSAKSDVLWSVVIVSVCIAIIVRLICA